MKKEIVKDSKYLFSCSLLSDGSIAITSDEKEEKVACIGLDIGDVEALMQLLEDYVGEDIWLEIWRILKLRQLAMLSEEINADELVKRLGIGKYKIAYLPSGKRNL